MKSSLSKNLHKVAPKRGINNSFYGTVLIPDISGFTKFVNETELNAGRDITRELLSVIINHNNLNLNISEIEGDAILFYKNDYIAPLLLKNQFEVMLKQFQNKLEELRVETGLEIDLSLKLIAHYGELSTYQLGKFEKLYGKTVIEAHGLLKNSILSNSYILITDSILKATKNRHSGSCYYSGSQICEVQGDLKRIGFTYFDYEKETNVENSKSLNELFDYQPELAYATDK